MTDLHLPPTLVRLCVALSSGEEGQAWRTAITEAAAASGMAINPDPHSAVGHGGEIYLRDTTEGFDGVPAESLIVILGRSSSAGTEAAAMLAGVAAGFISVSVVCADARGGDLVALHPSLRVRTPYPAQLMNAGDHPAVGHLELYRHGSPTPGTAVDWDLSVFNFEEKATRGQALGDLALAGRARCLVYGPYLVLPAGRWRAAIKFVVDKAGAERKFRFEWGGSQDFAQLAFLPAKPGIYEADLTHTLSLAEACELRLIMPESSLAGHFQLQSVKVEMVGRSAGLDDV